jgi:hypothetical protein
MFKIEDKIHAELQDGEFTTFEEALVDLQKRATIPWNEEPNRCPCTNWKDCERKYQIINYDTTQTPWKEIERKNILSISAKGVKWIDKK